VKAVVYSYRRGAVNNRLGLALAGVLTPWVLTCPPTDQDTFPYQALSAFDLAYLVLHNGPDPTRLYGDERPGKHDHRRYQALDSQRVTSASRVVFMEGCAGLRTAFPGAFLAAGCEAVIGSFQPTYDKTVWLGPAGWQGVRVVKALRRGRTVHQAAALSPMFEYVGQGGAKCV
jgi:hypothetical protein